MLRGMFATSQRNEVFWRSAIPCDDVTLSFVEAGHVPPGVARHFAHEYACPCNLLYGSPLAVYPLLSEISDNVNTPDFPYLHEETFGNCTFSQSTYRDLVNSIPGLWIIFKKKENFNIKGRLQFAAPELEIKAHKYSLV